MKNFINITTTEEEQVEQVKKWIKNNIVIIIISVFIGIGAIFTWNYYQNYQLQTNLNARQVYLNTINTNIKQNFESHTNYKHFAKMVYAKNNVNENDYTQAINKLNSINADNIIKDIANIYLAKIYINNKKYQLALSILENNKLNTMSYDLKGDIYKKLNNIKKSKENYQLALTTASSQKLKDLINMKLNDLN